VWFYVRCATVARSVRTLVPATCYIRRLFFSHRESEKGSSLLPRERGSAAREFRQCEYHGGAALLSNAPCDSTQQVLPVLKYPHVFAAAPSRAATSIAAPRFGQRKMVGQYFYADYCNGEVSQLCLPGRGGSRRLVVAALAGAQHSSFGQDAKGSVYPAAEWEGCIRIAPSP